MSVALLTASTALSLQPYLLSNLLLVTESLTLIAGTLTADRTVTLPDATGTVALTSDITDRTYATSIGDGSNTSYTVTHNLGSQDVIVQLYDNSSLDTVYADVVRTSTSVVTLSFGTAPATNDIRVLVSKIG